MTELIERLKEHSTYAYMSHACRVAMIDAATALAEREADRAAVVAWLRGARPWQGVDPHTANCLANMIERGQHLAGEPQ